MKRQESRLHLSKMPQAVGGWRKSSWGTPVPTTHLCHSASGMPFYGCHPALLKWWTGLKTTSGICHGDVEIKDYLDPFSTRVAMDASWCSSLAELPPSSTFLRDLISILRHSVSFLSFLLSGSWKRRVRKWKRYTSSSMLNPFPIPPNSQTWGKSWSCSGCAVFSV